MFTVISGCASSPGVLKCKFYYYKGTVRPTDQETVAMEFVTDSSQAEGPSPAT